MTLEPDEIEQIAQRVVALLHEQRLLEPVRLVDATTLAHALGVERDWVYAHAHQLGAVRLGGPRGRLRFDLDAVRQRLDQKPDRPPVHSPARRRRRALAHASEPPTVKRRTPRVAGRRWHAPGPTPEGIVPMYEHRSAPPHPVRRVSDPQSRSRETG